MGDDYMDIVLTVQQTSRCRHINEVVKTWLTLKHQANSESGKVELVFRPFLRWFDRSMEEHFTLGLRKVC